MITKASKRPNTCQSTENAIRPRRSQNIGICDLPKDTHQHTCSFMDAQGLFNVSTTAKCFKSAVDDELKYYETNHICTFLLPPVILRQDTPKKFDKSFTISLPTYFNNCFKTSAVNNVDYEGRKVMALALKMSLNAFKLAGFILLYQGTGKMPLMKIGRSMLCLEYVKEKLKVLNLISTFKEYQNHEILTLFWVRSIALNPNGQRIIRTSLGGLNANDLKEMGVHFYFRWALDDNDALTSAKGCKIFSLMNLWDYDFLSKDENKAFLTDLFTRMVTLLNDESSSVANYARNFWLRNLKQAVFLDQERVNWDDDFYDRLVEGVLRHVPQNINNPNNFELFLCVVRSLCLVLEKVQVNLMKEENIDHIKRLINFSPKFLISGPNKFISVKILLHLMRPEFERVNRNIFNCITNKNGLFRGFFEGLLKCQRVPEKEIQISMIYELVKDDPLQFQQEIEQVNIFDQISKKFFQDSDICNCRDYYKALFVQILNKLTTQDNMSKIVGNDNFFVALLNLGNGVKLSKQILALAIKLRTFDSNVLNIIQRQNTVTKFIELCMPFIGPSNGSEFDARFNDFYNELTRLGGSGISLDEVLSNSFIAVGNPEGGS